jgi:asparagine synthase (glutamine-hydrolysing)
LLDKLIWHLETYDIISVEQVCQCIFCQKAITESGIKVVSGEGADEILEVICILEMRLRQKFQKTIERVQSYLQQIYFVQINQLCHKVRN